MPVINDIFTARVRDLGSDGAAVVEHPCGQVFFVPGLWPGELARIRITGFRKRLGFGALEALLEPAAERVAPPCPHHGLGERDCGGCPWQFVSYPAQLEAKQARVQAGLERVGVAADAILPIWAAPATLGFRNRAQFKTDGRQLGYVAAASKRLAPIADCPILTGRNRETLRDLLALLPRPAWRPPRKTAWTTLDIDEDVSADSVAVNRRLPFRQANSAQNERMRSWLAAVIAPLAREAPVLELFAGSGNFTRVLASAGFDRIVAVEGVAEVVAGLNGRQLPGVSAVAADLFSERAVQQLGRDCAATQVLVLDPPRDGFAQLATLLSACRELQHIFYISCDLATFARDSGVLQQQGFAPVQVQPLDQLPHTPHVELLASFSRV